MNKAAIKTLIGERWSYPDNNCWDVFKKASRSVFGIEVSDIVIPSRFDCRANTDIFNAESGKKHWKRIDNPLPSCAVIFNTRSGSPIHIGLYIGGGDVLHCPGTPQKPESTRLDNLRQLKAIYPTWTFYAYAPNSND